MFNALLKHQRKLAAAGIIAPILYVGQVVIFGLLEPGFNHRTTMMSVLGGIQGWRGTAFNLGLVLIAALLILLAAAGIGLAGSSFFHCEVDCVNILAEPDFRGQMHMLFAFVAGLSLAFAPLAFYFGMKDLPGWKDYRGWTSTAFILSNIPGIVMWVSLFTTRLPEWEGLFQRLGLLFPLIGWKGRL